LQIVCVNHPGKKTVASFVFWLGKTLKEEYYMKKVLAIGLVLCLMLMALTGCQQPAPAATGSDTASAADTAVPATGDAPVSGELNVALAADLAPDSVTEWTKMFNADYPDV
jgi:hypothetical protein